MNPTVSALLTLLAKIAPTVAGLAGPRGVIISEIIQALPTIAEAGVAAITQVQSIIATLREDPAATQAELDQLDAADAAADKAFEDAAARAQAEDDAAGQA